MKKNGVFQPHCDADFAHYTFIGENGEILYHMPIRADEIHLEDFDATTEDLVTLRFHGTDPTRVLFVKTERRELAEFYWAQLTQDHNSKVMETRCIVPARRGGWLICPRNNSCDPKRCPYGKQPEEKQRHTVSWDHLISRGFEPAISAPVETQAIWNVEKQQVKVIMDNEDPRIWKVLVMREEYGMTVENIAEELAISPPRVYQLLARGKAIGAQFRKDNP